MISVSCHFLTFVLFPSSLLWKHVAFGWTVGWSRQTSSLTKQHNFNPNLTRHRKGCKNPGTAIYDRIFLSALASSTPVDGVFEEEDTMKQGAEMLSGNTIAEDTTIVNENSSEYNNPSWIRLAEYLVKHKKDLVVDKHVAIIGCSWISSVVTQLGPEKVVQYDDEINIKENQYQGESEILHLSQEARDIVSQKSHCLIQTNMVEELAENGDTDTIIITTTSSELFEDPFVNDFLRRTSSMILMDADMVDIFCYHARIQEGADIILW